MKRRSWIMFFAFALALSACASDGEGGDDTTTTPADTAETTAASDEEPTTTAGSDEEPTTTAGEEMADGVHTADSDLGSILVDGEGFTLYVFTNDTGGESTCYDGCAGTWPPVPGDTAIGSDLDASLFGTTARTDGTEQLTVNGQPLYRYTPDAAPGDTTGQGVGEVWFVVGADGSMIGGPEASVDLVSDDAGYDY